LSGEGVLELLGGVEYPLQGIICRECRELSTPLLRGVDNSLHALVCKIGVLHRQMFYSQFIYEKLVNDFQKVDHH
jgi:hypothetical protein